MKEKSAKNAKSNAILYFSPLQHVSNEKLIFFQSDNFDTFNWLLLLLLLLSKFKKGESHLLRSYFVGLTSNEFTNIGLTSNELTSNGLTSNGLTSNELTNIGLTSNDLTYIE
jgi:hypothetical protein